MTKKEILDYIIETPGNTNRAVLGDMLDSFGGGAGGGGGTEPLIVNIVDDETTGGERLDHTWQEIYNAPIAYLNLEFYGLSGLSARLSLVEIGQRRLGEAGDVTYYVVFGKSTNYYYADSEDGYPEAEA